jgi:hypothetical protein
MVLEHVSGDPKAARRFYESLLGRRDMAFVPGSPNHWRSGRPVDDVDGEPAMWVPYVKVEDTAAIAAQVAPLGGTLLLAPLDVKDVGRIAMFADPLGAVLGIIQPVVKA